MDKVALLPPSIKHLQFGRFLKNGKTLYWKMENKHQHETKRMLDIFTSSGGLFTVYSH